MKNDLWPSDVTFCCLQQNKAKYIESQKKQKKIWRVVIHVQILNNLKQFHLTGLKRVPNKGLWTYFDYQGKSVKIYKVLPFL